MFGFTRKSGVQSPSAAILGAMKRDGWPPGIETSSALGVVESRGSYAGRKVTYIRLFDPARAAERGLQVEAFGDLDAHPNLVLRAGHVEKDGTVVITWRAPSLDAGPASRERADRAPAPPPPPPPPPPPHGGVRPIVQSRAVGT
jgi:hypothetical protein